MFVGFDGRVLQEVWCQTNTQTSQNCWEHIGKIILKRKKRTQLTTLWNSHIAAGFIRREPIGEIPIIQKSKLSLRPLWWFKASKDF